MHNLKYLMYLILLKMAGFDKLVRQWFEMCHELHIVTHSSMFKKKWMTVDSWYIPSLILSKARGSFNSAKHICQLKVSWLTWWETTSACSPDEGGGSSEVVWGCPCLPKASKSFQWAAWLNRLQVLKINQPTGMKLCCHSFYVTWSWAGLTLCR